MQQALHLTQHLQGRTCGASDERHAARLAVCHLYQLSCKLLHGGCL